MPCSDYPKDEEMPGYVGLSGGVDRALDEAMVTACESIKLLRALGFYYLLSKPSKKWFEEHVKKDEAKGVGSHSMIPQEDISDEVRKRFKREMAKKQEEKLGV